MILLSSSLRVCNAQELSIGIGVGVRKHRISGVGRYFGSQKMEDPWKCSLIQITEDPWSQGGKNYTDSDSKQHILHFLNWILFSIEQIDQGTHVLSGISYDHD